MYFVKTPKVIKHIFPTFKWDQPSESKEIFLTFDDGPIPEVTPWVLEQLAKYNAKASFFCVGDNVRKYPEVFEMVLNEGHTIGNHTFNHLNGWHTGADEYLNNVDKCSEYFQSSLFRPPYGKISRRQSQIISESHTIIMWDVLSGDFDQSITKEMCLQNVLNFTKSGSIVVFHDNIKAREKLEFVLPIVLEYFSNLGYKFSRLEATKKPEIIRELVTA